MSDKLFWVGLTLVALIKLVAYLRPTRHFRTRYIAVASVPPLTALWVSVQSGISMQGIVPVVALWSFVFTYAVAFIFGNGFDRSSSRRLAPDSQFFRTREWDVLRRQVLLTYGLECMKCKTKDAEMHVDHIKPRSKYPELAMEFSNLQVLCRECNFAKWNHDETDYRSEVRAPVYVNPKSGKTYFERIRAKRYSRKSEWKRRF